ELLEDGGAVASVAGAVLQRDPERLEEDHLPLAAGRGLAEVLVQVVERGAELLGRDVAELGRVAVPLERLGRDLGRGRELAHLRRSLGTVQDEFSELLDELLTELDRRELGEALEALADLLDLVAEAVEVLLCLVEAGPQLGRRDLEVDDEAFELG